MDGTLWDTSKPVTECWNEVGKKIFGEGFSLSINDVQSQMGKQMDQILSSITPSEVTKEQIDEFKKEFLSFELDYINNGHPGILYPNEEETFRKLKEMGYGLYIVSNCQKGYIQSYLKSYPACAKYIDDVLCWGDTGLPKRGTIKQIIEDSEIDEAIYVGDTLFDEIETKGAGLPFIYAAYGFGTAISPDETIYGLEELPSKAKKYL